MRTSPSSRSMSSESEMAERHPYVDGGEIVRRVTRGARVLVVDDHRLLAQMLVDQLCEAGHEALAIDIADTRLVDRVIDITPDLLLLDAVFADDEDAGMRILRELGDRAPDLAVVMITGVTERIRHAEFLDAGARAVISKADSFDQVTAQIEDLLAGSDPMGVTRRHELARLLADHSRRTEREHDAFARLTDSERATLEGLVAGQSVQEMALRRTVAVSTVRSHVRAILRKLGVHSQIEAVAMAAKAGWQPRPPG